MAINPPTDIVLDVARAADPAKLQAAALRLTGATDDGDVGFSDAIGDLAGGDATRPAVISTPGMLSMSTDTAPKGPQLDRAASASDAAMKPYRAFEAFVLQSFIQSMLPHDAQGVFGNGTAGEVWKGMLAEQLGKQLARSGGIGIANQIFKSHPPAAADVLAGRAPLALQAMLHRAAAGSAGEGVAAAEAARAGTALRRTP